MKTIIILTSIILVCSVTIFILCKYIIKLKSNIKRQDKELQSFFSYLSKLQQINEDKNELQNKIKQSPENALRDIININNSKL